MGTVATLLVFLIFIDLYIGPDLQWKTIDLPFILQNAQLADSCDAQEYDDDFYHTYNGISAYGSQELVH